MVERNVRPVPGMGRLFAALAVMREIRREMEIQTVMAFLVVASSPGISMKDIERRLDLSSAATSRTISGLAEHGHSGRPGDGLVDVRENPQDRRYKEVYLTAKGERIAERIRLTVYGEEMAHGAAA